ncbi:GNAT family N-acetyltransferase [Natronorubrum daqingense]|uniref:Acetyltransferase (GNAT) family protein n=1 Tax=Natronorubrum daqingense TaxID=588898 RepID=A0A1N6YDF7_9EURY|nr:GNAT family N-acetyltransferase [Natronorubrum daqingense]APX95699.1 GNAT family N-acetyltransferase [Natronorubrum daqingense]SIR12655.1 Acetyltransferase (GNAT) family protein [Natronorubrum daqingense]
MEFELLGWPVDGPTLRLDYERFSYAGKFVMSNTGKAVARTDAEGDDPNSDQQADDIVAAVAFNEDRTDSSTLWLRYVTVERSHRGEGIGPNLCSFVRERALERDYERLRIAVNNPFAYEALYRSGFEFTGETTGIAELVLEYPSPNPVEDTDDTDDTDDRDECYQVGLEEFRDRELSEGEHAFLDDRRHDGAPGLETDDTPRGHDTSRGDRR